MRKPTIKDVAEKAGVSVGLVSMVLNNKKGVNKETAEKVMKVVKAMKYTPNKTASALRAGYNKTIGVITPDLANHYFSDISRHIENIAFDNGYTVLFGSSDDRPDKIGKLIEIFYANGVKGILLSPCDECTAEIKRALRLGMSIVMMNRDPLENNNTGHVLLDNEKAVRMGLVHLLDNGYRHIEMISNNIMLSTLKMRENSYLAAIAELGLQDTAKINFADERKPDELDSILKGISERGVDAIMVPRGYLALHVANSIKRIGLHIPDDIALIGFDGGETYKIVTPTITQLVQNTRKTAEISYNMLYEMMHGGQAGYVLIEPELVIGESTRRKY